jgi:hypothetical protein
LVHVGEYEFLLFLFLNEKQARLKEIVAGITNVNVKWKRENKKRFKHEKEKIDLHDRCVLCIACA